MTTSASPSSSPIRWVPSLYFVQGMQFFVVMLIAGLMFKNMGVSNEEITRATGALGLAWAIKPLWSPFLELFPSKKRIVVTMQACAALCLGAVALTLQSPSFFALTIAVLFLLAYASATHDIACDGLYMASLNNKQQAAYAGWQGAFFNASKFLTLGALIVWAGHLEKSVGVFNAWSTIFIGMAVLLACLAAYNAWALPSPANTAGGPLNKADVARTLREVIAAFLRKPGIIGAIAFIVLFRFAEGQVQTIGPLFMLEAREKGGLGLGTEQLGTIYGGIGTLTFLIGSILGGLFASKLGLKRAMPVLIVAMAVPNLVFAWLAHARPLIDAGIALPFAVPGLGHTLSDIAVAVAIEMFGYGFGFVGMILYIMQAVAPGPFQTAHYALGSGVMQLGFILSKTISGDFQAALGYERFFLWTVACGVPVFVLLWFVHLPGAQATADETQPQAGAPA